MVMSHVSLVATCVLKVERLFSAQVFCRSVLLLLTSFVGSQPSGCTGTTSSMKASQTTPPCWHSWQQAVALHSAASTWTTDQRSFQHLSYEYALMESQCESTETARLVCGVELHRQHCLIIIM